MINIDLNDISLKLNLENGIYSFVPINGNGKTYLYHLLNSAAQFCDNLEILTVTYSKFILSDLVSIIKSKKWDIILLDRFDLYYSKDINYCLDEIRNSSVILIDMKNQITLKEIISDEVSISIGEDLIEVNIL